MWVSSSFGEGDLGVVPSRQSKDIFTIRSEKKPCSRPGQQEAVKLKCGGREGDLWVQTHQPTSVADLAVHHKKVAQVQDWLKSRVLLGPVKDTPILLLTGPPGAGKTTTLKLLAQQEAVEVQEWVNPVTEVHQLSHTAVSTGPRQLPQATVFKDFLLRASQFTSLCMAGAPTSGMKLVLVEDFPNVFYRDSSQFHDVLRHVREVGCFPLVFIVSETSGKDSRVRELFPSELQQQLTIDVISFNTVAATNMQKALSCIVNKEAARKSAFKRPDKARIQEVVQASAGDIRSAVNLLQFSSLRVPPCSRTSGVKEMLKKNTGKDSSSNDKSSKLRPVQGRAGTVQGGGKDVSLFLFRALGKILYCKRSEEEGKGLPPLPPHLSHHQRMPMLTEPETVVHACSLSPEALCLFLQQNFPEFLSDVQEYETVTQYLSDADLMSSEWTAQDLLSNYGVSVATRGLMHAKRGVNRVGWRPLYKPEWYTVQKKVLTNQKTAARKYAGQCLPAVELFTQKLPYMSHIHPSCHSKLRFSSTRPQKLEETEAIFDSDVDEEEPQTLPSISLQQCTVPTEMEKDLIIEEYDSD